MKFGMWGPARILDVRVVEICDEGPEDLHESCEAEEAFAVHLGCSLTGISKAHRFDIAISMRLEIGR